MQGGGIYIYGTATLTNTNVYSNTVRWVLAFCPCPDISSIAPWNVTCSLSWQGGGVYVYSGGEATLTNSNVYQNEANYVRSLFEPSSSAPMERYALVFFYLQGGGLSIYGTATLTNTNVYSNEANYVRWPSALA